MNFEAQIQDSLNYLSSQKATESLEADPYWPKWHSPWWHMLLLHEMGETKRIPEQVVKTYVRALNQMPIKHFPIHPGDLPLEVDPYRGSMCHCQLGNVYQLLAAYGVDVDQELPWMRSWFLKNQMEDGGLNCDSDAYLVKDETPSSMVGFIAAFEAIVNYTNRPWTDEEQTFVAKGADFLIRRQLLLGSATRHNASEQISATEWSKLCFPRFYLYDHLRGLTALLKWAEVTQNNIPQEAISEVVADLNRRFPDSNVKIERHSYEDAGTLLESTGDAWEWRETATFFPLLDEVSKIGDISPFLSNQWKTARKAISQNLSLKELLL